MFLLGGNYLNARTVFQYGQTISKSKVSYSFSFSTVLTYFYYSPLGEQTTHRQSFSEPLFSPKYSIRRVFGGTWRTETKRETNNTIWFERILSAKNTKNFKFKHAFESTVKWHLVSWLLSVFCQSSFEESSVGFCVATMKRHLCI